MCAASGVSRERENKNENRDVISGIFYIMSDLPKYCRNMNKLLTTTFLCRNLTVLHIFTAAAQHNLVWICKRIVKEICT